MPDNLCWFKFFPAFLFVYLCFDFRLFLDKAKLFREQRKNCFSLAYTTKCQHNFRAFVSFCLKMFSPQIYVCWCLETYPFQRQWQNKTIKCVEMSWDPNQTFSLVPRVGEWIKIMAEQKVAETKFSFNAPMKLICIF